ncbi:hypothetical protein SMACR_01144 [Sordaria macrospora]|uniref:WGS project CABT00000000 data, contig 2.2 n=2 Tax=Sordaria macrospora TaxID=5147 RepID=F7VMD9_SORMK|nr:uncharacterized protein SMAC_01144 [Sordaria macrospora k-hell]KAA8631744.1 hypothetical protein SMACR_01144 [Sordaria macrospora]KAH7630485.1 hypothetical protein B0T09DRAFT_262982 [Sordaria sp. MPI-SDFR-AT-0083]CCC07120.1 unnamed protein product [Sordaria macrospora k-hell]
MVLQPRKKTSVEAGWIIFAVIFSTFSSALIILLCWWTTRGSSKKSSSSTEQEQQQQNESSSRQLTSRRSVRYWYYYPEYFGHNNGGSSEPPSDDYDASYTGTEYHLEQQQQHPDYYIYPPPPYPPTRPVNVMSFLVRNQRKREPPPPPVAEVTSPERTSTPTPEDGSSSSSGSSPDEPPPNGDGPPPHGPRGDPSGGPRPEGSAPDPPDPIIIDVDSPKSNGLAPDSPDPHIVDVQSPKSNGSVISRQDVSEAQANFGKLMSEAGSNICVVKRKAWVKGSIAKGVVKGRAQIEGSIITWAYCIPFNIIIGHPLSQSTFRKKSPNQKLTGFTPSINPVQTLSSISPAKAQLVAPKVSRLPSLQTLQPASVSYITPSLPDSTLSKPPQSSPAYGSGGYGVALSPQQQQKEHERKGSRQSTYSRHSGAKSPSAVSVSVVELLSLEKDVDQTGQGGGMSLLEHEEQEDPDEREDDEIVVLDEEGRLLSRRSVSNSRASSHRQIDPTDHQRDFMEMEHGQHQHDDQIRESPVLQPEPGPEPETEQVPEDYYRSYSPVVLAVGNPEPLLPSSPNLSAHSSNLSPRSPYHPGKYIPAPTQVPKENRPHQASVCSVSDSPDSGIGGVGDGKGKSE